MISVVIPVFNEAESVAELHRELLSVFRGIEDTPEIIFVEDGSTDDTLTVLKNIVFARNFGKSQALQAGFDATQGEYILTLDGDLQDDPSEIPRFLNAIEDGHADLICGWKQNRQDTLAKRIVSRFANGLTRLFTGTTVHDMNCGFKLFRKDVAKSLHLYGDMHRYIPALAATQGFRVGEVPVKHRERRFGVSKYGNLRRFSKSFFDFVTLLLIRRFIDRPMHFFGTVGMMFSLAGIGILAYLTFIKILYDAAIGDRPLLLLGILLIVVGIQLFSSGFLGELIIRQGSDRKVYTIREEIESK